MFKLNIHSIVDVITNSSTVIYTFQDNVEEAKELLQEVLNLVGNKEKVDDVFYIDTFLEEEEIYLDYLPEMDSYHREYPEREKLFETIKEDIFTGKMKKPEWMKECEEEKPTSLHIVPKNGKYEELAKKTLKFLNSVTCEEGFD